MECPEDIDASPVANKGVAQIHDAIDSVTHDASIDTSGGGGDTLADHASASGAEPQLHMPVGAWAAVVDLCVVAVTLFG